MSHFTVIVIGENPESQLELFSENLEMEPYQKFLDSEDVKRMAEFYDVSSTDLNALAAHLEDWCGEAGGIEDGRLFYLSTYNPNSKWDWYQLGGRWTGYFKTKSSTVGVTGEPGLLTADATQGYADQLYKRDIDVAGMRDEAAARALARWDLANSLIGEARKDYINWETICAKYGENLDEARAKYRAQPAVAKLIEHDEFKWTHDDVMCTREEMEARARASALSSFAVLMNGEWHEKGQMGWFACVTNALSEDQWNEEFSKLFDALPDDTLISAYDCHI